MLITREPGGTQLGEMIRDWVLKRGSTVSIGKEAELLLFLAARAQHIEEKILPALRLGQIVLCDRFNDSTIAYQGGARGMGMDYVQKLCRLVCGPVIPHLTLFLNIPPNLGLARSRGVHKESAFRGQLDRIESENLDFHHKIQESFEFLLKKEPERIYSIDATQPQEKVRKEAVLMIEKYIHSSSK